MVGTPTKVFTVLYDKSSNRVIRTMQGLVDKVVDTCKDHGYKVVFVDARKPFPEPRMELSGGWRFSQGELFKQMVEKKRSGTYEAPTRFGKTMGIINIFKVFPGVKAIITAPGGDLLSQMLDALREVFPDRDIRGIFTGAKNPKGKKGQSDDITVVSLDSLHKCDKVGTRIVAIDEPHAVAASSRAPELQEFVNARKFGFGATPEGRFDGADIVTRGLIGPALAVRTFKEAVAEGAICPIKVLFLKFPFKPYPCTNRNTAYIRTVMHNHVFNNRIQKLCNKVLPMDWQTIVFIKTINQAKGIVKSTENSEMATAKTFKNKKERQELFDRMKSGDVKRCISSDIYSAGVTFSDLKVVINAAGGGGSISAIQKPGRLAEIRPGKKFGYLIDFFFCCEENVGDKRRGNDEEWRCLINESWTRYYKYIEKGYDVEVFENIDDLQNRFEELKLKEG